MQTVLATAAAARLNIATRVSLRRNRLHLTLISSRHALIKGTPYRAFCVCQWFWLRPPLRDLTSLRELACAEIAFTQPFTTPSPFPTKGIPLKPFGCEGDFQPHPRPQIAARR